MIMCIPCGNDINSYPMVNGKQISNATKRGESCRKTRYMLILCDANYATKDQRDGKVTRHNL